MYLLTQPTFDSDIQNYETEPTFKIDEAAEPSSFPATNFDLILELVLENSGDIVPKSLTITMNNITPCDYYLT